MTYLPYSWVKYQVLEPYIALGSIDALYSRIVNFAEMSLRDHTLFFKLKRAELANTILHQVMNLEQ